MNRLSLMVLITLCVCSCAAAQFAQSHDDRPLTGNLRWDLLGSGAHQDSAYGQVDATTGRKSPLVAALLSAAVPGAGEFYSESYWRSGSFLATEIILWVIYAGRTAKGNAQTDEFQRYADQHWSVARYAQWIETNAAILNPDAPPCTGIITNPGAPNPWDQVDWGILNECESNIGAKASTGFSHRLPKRPDQQYYELIGKYLQYNSGWDDWGPGGPTVNEYLAAPSARFAAYSDMRGRANDYYNIASTASFLLVANHVLSALDAALAASEYNASLKIRAHLQPIEREGGFTEFVPTAVLSLSF